MAENHTSPKFNIISFLKKAVAVGASDVHLQVDEHPAIRIDGKITKVDMPALTEDDVSLAYDILLRHTLKVKLILFLIWTLRMKFMEFRVLG